MRVVSPAQYKKMMEAVEVSPLTCLCGEHLVVIRGMYAFELGREPDKPFCRKCDEYLPGEAMNRPWTRVASDE